MASDRLVFGSKVDMSLMLVLLGASAACLAVITQFWDAMSGGLWWARDCRGGAGLDSADDALRAVRRESVRSLRAVLVGHPDQRNFRD